MKPCPKCQQSNFKKATLVFMEGTQSSVGVGVSSAGIGVGAAQSTSKLASLCAPPMAPDRFMAEVGNMLLLVFFVPILVSTKLPDGIPTFVFIWAGIGAATFFWKFIQHQKKLAATQKKLIEEHEKKFVCLTCGEFSSPIE